MIFEVIIEEPPRKAKEISYLSNKRINNLKNPKKLGIQLKT